MSAASRVNSLMGAIYKNDIETIKSSITSGLDVNEKDHRGTLPLQYAVSLLRPELVKLLLEHGANPNVNLKGSIYVRNDDDKMKLAIIMDMLKAAGRPENVAKAAPSANTSIINDYIAKVKSLKERMEEDTAVEQKIKEGFDALGHKYFDLTSTGYVGPDVKESTDEVMSYTKKAFIEAYEDEGMDFDEEDDEASFSDAYRHAGLVNTKTLEVIDPREKGVNIKDYVFRWSTVQKLPSLLKGTDYVALHLDTEGGWAFFFPLPSKPRMSGGGKRKSRRASRKHRRSTRRAH